MSLTEKTGKQKLNKKASVFWKYFIMMLSILVISSSMLLISDRIMFREIAAANSESIHSDFEYNCNALEEIVLEDTRILNSIEKSKYYSYLKEQEGIQSSKNAAVLYYIGNLLS